MIKEQVYENIAGKSSYKVMIETYNSTEFMVEDLKKRDYTCDSFRRMQAEKKFNSRSFYGDMKSIQDAYDMLEKGWDAKIEKFKEHIKNAVMGDGKRITFKNDIVGYAPIVPLAMQGVPTSMLNSTMKPMKAKVIDLYYDMTCSCGIDFDDIVKNGIKLLSAIIDLEMQGYRLNVYAVQTYADSYGSDVLKLKIKDSSQPFDLKRMAFPLGHAGFFRGIGFEWYSKTPKGTYRGGYGHALTYEFGDKNLEDFVSKVFSDTAVYISGTKILEKGYEHINEMIVNGSKRTKKN